VPEQLRLDLEVERDAIRMLNAGIETAASLGDNGTRELLEQILEGEEHHANWIEAQMSLIAQDGRGNYLAQQIKDGDE
jgi:bacterioferritin